MLDTEGGGGSKDWEHQTLTPIKHTFANNQKLLVVSYYKKEEQCNLLASK